MRARLPGDEYHGLPGFPGRFLMLGTVDLENEAGIQPTEQ
jgi:hypothetical protein